VAAITVNAYDTENCKLISTASGRQNGQWFTFVCTSNKIYASIIRRDSEGSI